MDWPSMYAYSGVATRRPGEVAACGLAPAREPDGPAGGVVGATPLGPPPKKNFGRSRDMRWSAPSPSAGAP
jgi:hypothetical protein